MLLHCSRIYITHFGMLFYIFSSSQLIFIQMTSDFIGYYRCHPCVVLSTRQILSKRYMSIKTGHVLSRSFFMPNVAVVHPLLFLLFQIIYILYIRIEFYTIELEFLEFLIFFSLDSIYFISQ